MCYSRIKKTYIKIIMPDLKMLFKIGIITTVCCFIICNIILAKRKKLVLEIQTLEIPTLKDGIKTSKMIMPPPKDGIKTSKMIMPTPKDGTKTSKMIMPTPKDGTKTSKMIMPTPKDGTKSSKMIMPTPKDGTKTSKMIMPTPKDGIKTSKMIMPTPKDGIKTSKMIMPAPKDETKMSNSRVQMPKEVVQRLKGYKTFAVTLEKIYRNISKFFQLSNSDPRDPLLNLHQFNYIINLDKCQNNVYLLTVIHSSSDKWLRRNQIRTSWGGYRGSNGKYFRTVFMLGNPKNRSIQPAIVQEAMKYNDIVQGDFEDTYRNLTYKHIMVLSWVTEYCPHVEYILKGDDDIMVNVYNMMKYLNISKPQNNSIYCQAFKQSKPQINIKSKWKVSKSEYPFTIYPQYCNGFAYITTPNVAAKLLKVSRNSRFFWIDDVLVTGVLTFRANVSLTSMVANHGHVDMSKRYIGPGVRNAMFIIVRNNERYWSRTWRAILKHRT